MPDVVEAGHDPVSGVVRVTTSDVALVFVIVEHHPWVIAGADYVVEFGPGGGQNGGKMMPRAPRASYAARTPPPHRP